MFFETSRFEKHLVSYPLPSPLVSHSPVPRSVCEVFTSSSFTSYTLHHTVTPILDHGTIESKKKGKPTSKKQGEIFLFHLIQTFVQWTRRHTTRVSSHAGNREDQELIPECVDTTPTWSLTHRHYSLTQTQTRHVFRCSQKLGKVPLVRDPCW